MKEWMSALFRQRKAIMQLAGSKKSPVLSPLFLIGFSSVVAQIVLMRELIVVCNGNEIALGLILASWLMWTAVGSGLGGRITARFSSPRRTVAVLELLVAAALPVSVFAARASRNVFHVTPGEVLGPGPMLITSVVTLSVFCVVSGALFAAGSRFYAAERRASTTIATGSVYLLEAAGSAAGGVVSSLILIRLLPTFEIVLLVSILNVVVAWRLTRVGAVRYRVAPVLIVVVLIAFLWPLGGRALESLSNRVLWRGFDLVDVRNSIYGNLAVVATGDTRSIYENGVVLFSVPDREAAEESVHYALLEHQYPRSLLLIGGGMNGSLSEALKHEGLTLIDYVELDPTIVELGREYMHDEWSVVEADQRVNIHHTDGRLFLKRSRKKYDVIIVNLPDPQTAQFNRFYTEECFREAAARLAPGGVFSFRVTGAENYISEDLAGFLKCINKTVRAIYPRVTAIPGATIHFFAAVERGATTSDSNVLLDRLHARGVETDYVNESFVPFRMTPDRMEAHR
ncbi:MAG: fused MFS/spermidine synthase [bacterium]